MARPLKTWRQDSTRPGEDEALATADTAAPLADADTSLHDFQFPRLDGADERRMEDLLAARLFPRQAAALRIGRYTLLDRLGQGGMGVVYAAYDPELDRRVAIKLLGAALAGRAEERLVREAQAMARVVHANVVSVIEVGRDQGQAYVVMEHLRGISLDRWAERQPGWREVLRVYVQAGRGLAAAHRAGVIHRDFKPSNVMIVEGGVDDGRVKVLDFGLARAALSVAPATLEDPLGGALAHSLTRTGAVMGTPGYMAPEQLEGAPADERSDQFSFAVSLYEALYGQLPFDTRSLHAYSQALLSSAVLPPPAGTAVPAWVLRVVLQGLARAPEARHASMTAMCDLLERDPAVRRRTIGLSLALSAVVGAGSWSLAQLGSDAASPCSGPSFALTDVWSDARAAEVEHALSATGRRFAADTARRVRPILDEYAAAWSSMRTATCEAHQRGEQSPQLLDLRMACLDRRRAGFASLVALLAGADGAVAERAVEAALQLPSLAGCADTDALLAGTPLPDDRERALAVEAARRRLAELDALAGAGRFDEAASAAEVALAEAEGLAFAPLVAEAALALGSFELERRRGEQAERALSLAARAGIEGRADQVTAEALSRRLFVRSSLLGASERALADEELVAAHTARFPHDGALQWLTANNRGVVAHLAQDHGRARELFERALAVADGPTPLDLARTRINLGLLAFDLRDFEAALASFRAAVAQASETLGATHPLVDQLGVYEASALMRLGRKGAARARLEAMLDHPESEASTRDVWPSIQLALIDNHYRRFDAATARANQALALTTTSDVSTLINVETALAAAATAADEAQVLHDRVLRRARTLYGATHASTANILRLVGEDVLRRGRPGDALPLLREALAISEQVEGVDSSPTAAIRRALSDALLALGRPDEALASAEAASATFAALPGDRTLDLALSHRSLARAHLARGEGASAAQALRAALAGLEARVDPDDPDLAATRVELARALLAVEAGDAEARALLARAREAYMGLGEPFAPERAELARLLAMPAR